MFESIVGTVLVVHQSLQTLDNVVLSLEVSVVDCGVGRTGALLAIVLAEHIGQGNLTLSLDKGPDPADGLCSQADSQTLQLLCAY